MDFWLDLNEEHNVLRTWVHRFAEGVVRPAAAQWDEREEMPWPVIQEAAKIGLYGFEFLMNTWSDSTGLSLPLVNEELFWGDGGIAMAISGTSLAVAAIYGSGTPDQLVEWVPQCFGDAADPKLRVYRRFRRFGVLTWVFLVAGWRVAGVDREPFGRPGPGRVGFGGLAGLPMAGSR